MMIAVFLYKSRIMHFSSCGDFFFFFYSADHEYFSFFEKCSFLMVRLLCVCVVLKLEIFALYAKEHFE